MKDRALRDWLVFQRKKHRPSLLVTHCDDAVGPAAWAAGSARVLCHRYTSKALQRKTVKGASRRVTFIVHSLEAEEAVTAVSAVAKVVDPLPLELEPSAAPETYAVGTVRAADAEKIRGHFLIHGVEIPVISGDELSVLRGASVVVDLAPSPEPNQVLLEAQRWGRLVAVPEGTPHLSAYGEEALVFSPRTLYSILLSPPEFPEPRRFRGLQQLRQIYLGAS